MRTGFISKVNAGLYDVFDGKDFYHCRARGLFRIGEYTPFVGDYVDFDETENYLMAIKPRKNFIGRPPIANIDQVIIIASITNPVIPPLLINRFVVLSEIAKIKPIIVFSKADLVNEEDYMSEVEQYRQMGYIAIPYSCKTLQGLEEIKSLLAGKKTVFTGQSGVGKSKLINLLIPGLLHETQEISKGLGRGKHTTRIVEYLRYEDAWIADTPGFSSIELDLKPIDLAALFPGFENYYSKCKFRNCLHESESDCAIKDAVAKGEISEKQYETYLNILNELKTKKERY